MGTCVSSVSTVTSVIFFGKQITSYSFILHNRTIGKLPFEGGTSRVTVHSVVKKRPSSQLCDAQRNRNPNPRYSQSEKAELH